MENKQNEKGKFLKFSQIALLALLCLFLLVFIFLRFFMPDVLSEFMKLSESESSTPSASSLPSLSPSPSPTPTPTPEPTPEIFTISMVGDCTLSSSQREDRFETVLNGDMSWPFSGTLEYFEDDYLSIANLECNFSDDTLYSSKLFNFKGPSEHAKILSLGSIEYVALGNNHIMDFGQKGLDDTIAILDAEGIAHSGPNSSIIYFIDDGIRIGLYSAPWGATLEQVVAGVEQLKAEGICDIIIVLMHWGKEGSYQVFGTQTSIAEAAIDAGADIVYGSHPHVLQRIEKYSDSIIIYSLGNFSFGGNSAPRDRDTAIVQIDVIRDIDKSVRLGEMRLIPCSLSSDPVYNDYRPVPYEKGTPEYERALSKLNGEFTGPDLVVDYSSFRQNEQAPPASPPDTPPPAPTSPPDTGSEGGGGEGESGGEP